MKRSPAAHLMDGNGPAGWPKPPPAHGQSCYAATTGCSTRCPGFGDSRAATGRLVMCTRGIWAVPTTWDHRDSSFAPLPIHLCLVLFCCCAGGQW